MGKPFRISGLVRESGIIVLLKSAGTSRDVRQKSEDNER